jgi:ligand-binding sensor domain-containing protein
MFFKSLITLITAFFSGLIIHAQGIVPIGDWREHLPYYHAMTMTKGQGKIFCSTPFSFFSVDAKDNSIERFSKINGLSEVGISAIEYDTKTGKLLVAYSNSNVDILYQNNISNIDAIKRKEINADKTIYNIYPFQSRFYLSTGLGVIVIDEDKLEIKDTYIIGSGGSYTRVNGFCSDASFFYAATEEGLKKAGISNLNLSDFRNWQLLSGNGLPAGAVQNTVALQNKIIAQVNDSLWVMNGNNWSLFYSDDWEITGIKISDEKILTCQQKNGVGRILILNSNGIVEKNIQSAISIPAPRQAILLDNETWIADTATGLNRYNNSFQNLVPNSPYGIATGEMVVEKNVLWVASGTVTEQWNSTNTKKGIFRFTQDEWLNYTNKNIAALDSFPDIITVTVDPRDETLWAGSFGGGLLQLKKDNTVQIYKQNSPLEASSFAPGSYRVSGLAYDNENNLWISNYGAAQDIAVRKADGSWRKFFIPYTHVENAVVAVISR